MDLSFASPPAETRFLPPRGQRARKLALFLMAIGPFLVGALALFLGQDANWDFRNYHWYNGFAAATGRLGSDLLPSQTPSFYNPALDIPFYLLASAVSAKTASFVLGFVQGLNFPLLFMLAHATLVIHNPRQKVLVSGFLAALGLLGGGGIALIGTTFYDNVTSLGLFLSALLILRFWDGLWKGRPSTAFFLALIAGLPTGMAMGLKLPSVIFCVGLCGALLLVTGKGSRRLLVSFACGIGILCGLALTLGPWSAYLYSTYESPLFPYFNDFFGSPFAPPTDARDTKFIPSGFWDRLFFPFLFMDNPLRVGEIVWQDFRLPLLYALTPFALVLRLLFGRNKRSPDLVFRPYFARFLLWLGFLSYLVWLLLFAIYRYLIPLEMLAPLLLVIAVGQLPLRFSSRALVAFFVLLGVVVSIKPGDWGRHAPWLDKMVEVDLPALDDRVPTMVLMTGFEPYSHVIPAFPHSFSFVRVQSNFTWPDKKTGFNALIDAKVAAHKGSFKLLTPDWELDGAANALKNFDLSLLPQTCLPVRDRLYDSRLVLCDVQPKEKP